jgi:peptide-methionine (R)-S-oxide reductase
MGVRKCPTSLREFTVRKGAFARLLERQETGPREREMPSRLRARDLGLECGLSPAPAGHEHELPSFLRHQNLELLQSGEGLRMWDAGDRERQFASHPAPCIPHPAPLVHLIMKYVAIPALILSCIVAFKLAIPSKPIMADKTEKPADERLAKLTDEQFYVTQRKGTESPFTGKYWNHDEDGTYKCIVCGVELFTSESKFDSGCGWPSFDAAAAGKVDTHSDTSHGMQRDEIVCHNCGAHLGHVFPDGPTATGLRYCVNSASIDFKPKQDDGKK